MALSREGRRVELKVCRLYHGHRGTACRALARSNAVCFEYNCTSGLHSEQLQAAARKDVNIISARVRFLPILLCRLIGLVYFSPLISERPSLETLTGVGLALGWRSLGWGRLNLVKSCLQRRETGTGDDKVEN